jgi:3-isopropylmalate/(R)-2-methylmalate dehydratase small subunit
MKPYEVVKSKMVPLDIPNVDTDQIIPKQFLKRIERTGFGQFLFFDWRFKADGGLNPDFIANKPQYQNCEILLARDNFGCGSSREHAPWALLDYGFKVVIAPSYADIFYNNCFQNGILPVKLKPAEIDKLFVMATSTAPVVVVDLACQTITADDTVFTFEIDAARKEKLVKGLDDISWTLQYEKQISQYENSHVIF